MTQISSDIHEEANEMLGLAAELGAQLWLLSRDARGTGIEMALARHVTSQRHKHARSEGEFISAEQRCEEHVARRGKSAVGAQADASAEPVHTQNLLCFAQTKLPRISRVLDAAEGGCTRAAVVSGDHDVIGVSLSDPRCYCPYAELRHELHPYGRA